MTTKQYVAQLDKRLKEIENADHFFPCVQGLHNEQVARIFDFGQGGERPIGQYSTKPIYIGRDTWKLPPKGKDTERAKKIKKNRKDFGKFLKQLGVDSKIVKSRIKGRSRYFEGGYKEFKQYIGRESSFVNLSLSYDLRKDFSNSLTRQGAMWLSGVKRADNSDKVDGSVARFGEQTWHVTEAERKEFAECCKRQRLKKKI